MVVFPLVGHQQKRSVSVCVGLWLIKKAPCLIESGIKYPIHKLPIPNIEYPIP
jgi:hypothetical protein